MQTVQVTLEDHQHNSVHSMALAMESALADLQEQCRDAAEIESPIDAESIASALWILRKLHDDLLSAIESVESYA